jgi:hypothetical protein
MTVNQYMKAICRNRATVASEMKCIDNRAGSRLSVRSTDQ